MSSRRFNNKQRTASKICPVYKFYFQVYIMPLFQNKRFSLPLPMLNQNGTKSPHRNPSPTPSERSRRRHELEPRMSDLFLKTDFHGLPDFYESYHDRRVKFILTWTIILALAMSVLAWQICETWNDFVDNPVLTTYSVIH